MYKYTDMLEEYRNQQDLISYINLNLKFASISDKLINIQYIDNLALDIARTAFRMNNNDILNNLRELCMLIPDPVAKPEALLSIFSIKNIDLSDIEVLINEIERCILNNPNQQSSWRQSDLYVNTLFAMGKAERAMNFIPLIKDMYQVANLYYSISMEIWNSGDSKYAQKILDKSYEFSLLIQDDVNKIMMLNIIAKVNAVDYQEIEKAIEIWNISLNISEKLDDEMYKSMLSLGIALDLIYHVNKNSIKHTINRVLGILDIIDSEGFVSSGYKEIISSLNLANKLEFRSEIIERIYHSSLKFKGVYNKCIVLPEIALFYDSIDESEKTREVLLKSIECITDLESSTYYPTAVQIILDVLAQLNNEELVDDVLSRLFKVIFNLIDNESEKSKVFYNIASDLAKLKNHCIVRKYLHVLLDHTLKIEEEISKITALSKIIQSFGFIKDYDQVFILLKEFNFINKNVSEDYWYFTALQNIKSIADIDIESDKANLILDFCASKQSSLSSSDRICTFSTEIASSYIYLNDTNKAKQLLIIAIDLLKNIDLNLYLYPAVSFISSIASKIKDSGIALELLDRMVNTIDNLGYSESKLSSSINISYAYREIKDIKNQKILFYKAFDYINKIEDNEKLLYGISDICNELMRFEDEDEVIRILEVLLEKSKSIKDIHSYRRVLSSISYVAANTYDPQKGWIILEKLLNTSNNNKSLAYSSFAIVGIANAYKILDQKDKAKLFIEKYLSKISKEGKSCNAYNDSLHIACAYDVIGDGSLRQKFLDEASSKIQHATNIIDKINHYLDLSKTYLKFLDAQKAFENLDKAIYLAKTIENDFYYVNAMSNISTIYSYTSEKNRGKEILAASQQRFNTIKELDLKVVLTSTIAKSLAMLGYKNEAKIQAGYVISQLGNLPGENLYCEVFSNIHLVFMHLGEFDIAIKYLDLLSMCEVEYIKTLELSSEMINNMDEMFDILYIASKSGKAAYILSLGMLIGSLAKIDKLKAESIIDYVEREFIR